MTDTTAANTRDPDAPLEICPVGSAETLPGPAPRDAMTVVIIVDGLRRQGDAVHVQGTCGDHAVSLCLPGDAVPDGVREVRLIIAELPRLDAADSATTPTFDAIGCAIDDALRIPEAVMDYDAPHTTPAPSSRPGAWDDVDELLRRAVRQ